MNLRRRGTRTCTTMPTASLDGKTLDMNLRVKWHASFTGTKFGNEKGKVQKPARIPRTLQAGRRAAWWLLIESYTRTLW